MHINLKHLNKPQFRRTPQFRHIARNNSILPFLKNLRQNLHKLAIYFLLIILHNRTLAPRQITHNPVKLLLKAPCIKRIHQKNLALSHPVMQKIHARPKNMLSTNITPKDIHPKKPRLNKKSPGAAKRIQNPVLLTTPQKINKRPCIRCIQSPALKIGPMFRITPLEPPLINTAHNLPKITPLLSHINPDNTITRKINLDFAVMQPLANLPLNLRHATKPPSANLFPPHLHPTLKLSAINRTHIMPEKQTNFAQKRKPRKIHTLSRLKDNNTAIPQGNLKKRPLPLNISTKLRKRQLNTFPEKHTNKLHNPFIGNTIY